MLTKLLVLVFCLAPMSGYAAGKLSLSYAYASCGGIVKKKDLSLMKESATRKDYGDLKAADGGAGRYAREKGHQKGYPSYFELPAVVPGFVGKVLDLAWSGQGCQICQLIGNIKYKDGTADKVEIISHPLSNCSTSGF